MKLPLMSNMKAIVYYGPGDIRFELISIPKYRNNELLVKVDACAVCGTDLKSFRSGNPRIKAPIVMGHEFTGYVENIGRSVRGFDKGERIVMATSVSCGECYYCKKGWKNLCKNIAPMGYSFPGGMAEYISIPERALKYGHVIKVPANVKAEHAALAEPLSCAINAAVNARIQPGELVVVLGAGPMGLMNALVAKALGARKIIISEINDERLSQAREFDIDVLVNPEKMDLTEIVKENTGGYGADTVIVAAPAALPQETAVKLVRKKGTICLFASLPLGNEMLSINSRVVHYGEITIVGSSDSTPEHVKKAVEMISTGQLPADKLVTHIMKLGQISKAFDLMETGQSLRIVLKS
jgi:L-iditol 2-dehydrogenase